MTRCPLSLLDTCPFVCITPLWLMCFRDCTLEVRAEKNNQTDVKYTDRPGHDAVIENQTLT